jgi:3',5'-cyclic AMP phosphodiesterase CpdA
MSVRLAHFSDVHITTAPLGWQWRDWTTKRVTGWINTHLLSRRHRFRHAADTLARIIADISERRPDAVLFSGDATMMGFPAEVERAAKILRVAASEMPGFAVPGNHDYYTAAAVRSGAFERCFAPWLVGERLDGQTYPFARQIGPVSLVGVNSSVANVGPSDASGEVGQGQLQRLERLLSNLPAGPRILVTHYPVARPDGRPESVSHGLRDLDALLAIASKGGVRLWLHGHRHEWYVLNPGGPQIPFSAICAGSATEAGISGYNEYTISGNQLRFVRRDFDAVNLSFQDRPGVEIPFREAW